MIGVLYRERKEKYVSRIAEESASIVLVSAADELHNAKAVLSVGRFNPDADVAGTIGYYCGLPRLIGELDRTVSELVAGAL